MTSAFTLALASETSQVAMTTTLNGAASHTDTGEALTNLFYGACRGLEPERFLTLLIQAWKADPLLTLRLVAYIRNVRGGKGERELGRLAFQWLAQTSPRDLLYNLPHYLGVFGRWDDGVALVALEQWTYFPEDAEGNLPDVTGLADLTNAVFKVYHRQLLLDLDCLKKGFGVSLCAKWIPSENKSLDRKFKFNRGLGRNSGWTHRELRNNLTSLRKKIDLVETHLCQGTLEEIDYSKVPSVAMNRHSKPDHAFPRRDPDRFQEYRDQLKNGTVKINSGALFPHEVVAKYLQREEMGSVLDEITEAQWRGVCERLTIDEREHLKGVLTMVDVSGSMYHGGFKQSSVRPIDVAISLGLLVSEMNLNPAFYQTVMTFSSQPEFCRITGETLHERVQNLSKANWGTSTDFIAAYRLILNKATEFRLMSSEMPTSLLVISDMQFNSADSGFETNFKSLQREYTTAGYIVPKLVFWNVNGRSTDSPVLASELNTSLVSGFNIEILRDVFIGEDITPFRVMLHTLEREDYQCINRPPSSFKIDSMVSASAGVESGASVDAGSVSAASVPELSEVSSGDDSRDDSGSASISVAYSAPADDLTQMQTSRSRTDSWSELGHI